MLNHKRNSYSSSQITQLLNGEQTACTARHCVSSGFPVKCYTVAMLNNHYVPHLYLLLLFLNMSPFVFSPFLGMFTIK